MQVEGHEEMEGPIASSFGRVAGERLLFISRGKEGRTCENGVTWYENGIGEFVWRLLKTVNTSITTVTPLLYQLLRVRVRNVRRT